VVVDDQHEVIGWLSQPQSYGAAHQELERIDTHSAIVFLVGSDAYKLKRAVRYDYLDFSTVDRRRRACEAEVALNRRTAPDLYLGALPITRGLRGLRLGGEGPALDWVIHMRRFDGRGLMDHLAAHGQLDLALMAPLAEEIAELHARAERRVDHGGFAGMRWVVEGNARSLLEDEGGRLLDHDACAGLIARTRECLARNADQLELRRTQGWVRTCHGDLHLGNIVVIDGRPVLFDAIEFNDRIACIDVLYDLAFVLMDLWRLGLVRHANELFNAYLATDGDLDALELLPLFLACRSTVRAKTSATAASLQLDASHADPLVRAAGEYLERAEAFLRPAPPRLIAIGGRSGSGKSTQAQGIAGAIGAAPGAVVLRSDVIRKAIFGLRATSRLGPEGYAPQISRQVYDALAGRAARALRAGHSVVVDAVFDREANRRAVAEIATRAAVPFTGIWLDAPASVLGTRISTRTGDASDATASVLDAQLRHDPGPIDWITIDASGSADEVERAVRSALGA